MVRLTKGHKATEISEPGMIDRVECSCGWRSPSYYDGREYAFSDYRKHVQHAAASGRQALEAHHEQ